MRELEDGAGNLQTVGKRLLWARQRAKITQVQLAQRTGVSQQLISKMERDMIDSPDKEVIMNISKELGVSPAWLMYGRAELEGLSEEALAVAIQWDSMKESDHKRLLREILLASKRQKQSVTD